MDAFDADALIYAAVPGHMLGARVLALFADEAPEDGASLAGIGSVLLLPEILAKHLKRGDEVELLGAILGRVDLRPVDGAIARLAVALAARYGLRAADAVHLATAVGAGADRFITNNRRDFLPTIAEVDVTYPDELPDPDLT